MLHNGLVFHKEETWTSVITCLTSFAFSPHLNIVLSFEQLPATLFGLLCRLFNEYDFVSTVPSHFHHCVQDLHHGLIKVVKFMVSPLQSRQD